MNDPVYETERLLLRPTSTEDASFILDLLNSPKWLRYIGDRNVKTPEQALEYIRVRFKMEYERLGFSSFTVIRKTDLAKIGTCGLYDREGVDGIDIGFAFLPHYEGRGYAFEAAEKVMLLAFYEFGISELKAITSNYNLASKKLLDKLGMTASGKLTLPGDKEELLVYSIQKPEQSAGLV